MKTVAQTSAETYREIKDSGLLMALCDAVYLIMIRNRGKTAGEIAEIYKAAHPNDFRPRNEIAKIISELKRQKKVIIIGERECTVAKRNVYVWGINDGETEPYKEKETSADKIRRLTAELAEANKTIDAFVEIFQAHGIEL